MNQNAIETKNNLLEAFLRMYEQKPLSQITVKEVCTVAGYNRTTFYNHFVDMPDLLGQIEDETLGKIEAIVSRLTARDIFQTDALFMGVKGIYQANQRIMSLLMTKTDSHFPPKMKSLMFRTITGFCQGLSVAESKKLNVAITYHFSAVLGVFSHWIQRQDGLQMEEMVDYVKEISQGGFLTAINKMVQ